MLKFTLLFVALAVLSAQGQIFNLPKGVAYVNAPQVNFTLTGQGMLNIQILFLDNQDFTICLAPLLLSVRPGPLF